MDAAQRIAASEIGRLLLRSPEGFNFFQAVRLLQVLNPDAARVGSRRLDPEKSEVVRFRAAVSLAFPKSTICSLRLEKGQPPLDMTVSFMGMTGPRGLLPLHYTQLLLERVRRVPPDYALRDFLDVFHHRLLSLFYRAWEKHRIFVSFEHSLLAAPPRTRAPGEALAKPDDGVFERVLFSLIGFGTEGMRSRLSQSDLDLLRYVGLFTERAMSAVSLERLLNDYFAVPIAVEQFIPEEHRLDEHTRMRLGRRLGRLGKNFVLGDRVHLAQGKFRLRIGPLSVEEFREFQPRDLQNREKPIFRRLVELTRLCAGPELEFDVMLVLKASDVPPFRLGVREGPHAAQQLGRSTWLQGKRAKDTQDTVFPGRIHPTIPPATTKHG